MLKAVQILGSSSSSSGLVSSFSQTLKLKKKAPHPNCVCEFFLISQKSIATTTTTISLSSRKLAPFLLQVHKYSHKGHFSNFRASTMSLAHTESNPDGPSSSSSPASAVTTHSSAVSFLVSPPPLHFFNIIGVGFEFFEFLFKFLLGKDSAFSAMC